MSALLDKLLSDNLKALKPYESARRLFAGGAGQGQQIWLNANESPFANDYELDCNRLNRYPDCQPEAVVQSYAHYAGVEAKQTLVSRGADEGIELLIRAFCVPGQDSILICPPTYGMYAISAETCNVGIKRAPLNTDFSLDTATICSFKDQVNVVFICSPNNPTGTSVDKAQLQQVIEHFADSAIVVVDEAYIEFDADNTWAAALNKYNNLVILRTLSKAYALAGIRCGFALAHEDIIQAMLKVIAPYPIPEPVAQIAAQALSGSGIERMQQQVAVISGEKARMKQWLGSIPAISLVGDDRANFILFRYEKKQALMDFLVANGVLIRDQSKQLNLANCLRITLGSEQQNNRLIELIQQFFTSQEPAV